MTYRPSEKASVENPVVKFATDLGVKVLKVNPLWSAGWPDRVFFLPGGRPLLIEFKRSGGKTRAKQDEVIAKLRSHGYEVVTIDSVEEGKEAIRSRLEAHGLYEKGNPMGPGASRKRPLPRPRFAKD